MQKHTFILANTETQNLCNVKLTYFTSGPGPTWSIGTAEITDIIMTAYIYSWFFLS